MQSNDRHTKFKPGVLCLSPFDSVNRRLLCAVPNRLRDSGLTPPGCNQVLDGGLYIHSSNYTMLHRLGNTSSCYPECLSSGDNTRMNSKPQIAVTLQKLMERRDISANALHRATGVPQPTITRLLQGKSVDPRDKTIAPIARHFNVSLMQLRGYEALPFERSETNERGITFDANVTPGPDITMLVPEISWVQAGQWQEIIDNYHPGDFERVIPVSKKMSPRSFALRVRGDSMADKFPEGCTIVVDPEFEPNNGSYVIARINDATEATFKQLVLDAGRAYLKPLNPRYPIIEIDEHTSICGVVRHMLWDFE